MADQKSTMHSASPKTEASAQTVHVVGAGLAGSECALQLAEMGHEVVLIEMRGGFRGESVTTPAHKTGYCAELVCSNSFGSLAGTSAPGELKWEAEQLGSHILDSTWSARVPAGQALGMDREVFAKEVTRKIDAHPLIRRESRVVRSLDELPRPCVVATGPLTQEDLARSMQTHFGDEFLYFFDAIAPILATESINMDIAWRADRWDKGTKDYINCPFTKDEYFNFIAEIKAAKKTEAKDFEKDTPYFESCMPIEAMIERGDLTPRFGPMSAKGLKDPRTGKNPFAVVQLRQDNKEGTAYNIVGFQTKMAYGEQKRIFRMIPGLEGADFLKLGSIHRNLYINTPKRLNRDLSSKKDPWLFFAGQITGVEGYFESTCMGILVARFLHEKSIGRLALDASNIDEVAPPRASALGSLLAAINDETKIDHFQPTNINFGHMPPISDEPILMPNGKKRRIEKTVRRAMQVTNAREAMTEWLKKEAIGVKTDSRVERAGADLIAATEIALAESEAAALLAAQSKVSATAPAQNIF